MNAKYGNLYAGSTIKAGTYPGQTTDNKNTVVWNILVSNAKMSDQDAYNIVKTIFDKKADLVAVHSEAKNFSLENQVKDYSPIPWHPGAIKYMASEAADDAIGGVVDGREFLDTLGTVLAERVSRGERRSER